MEKKTGMEKCAQLIHPEAGEEGKMPQTPGRSTVEADQHNPNNLSNMCE